MYTTLTYSLAEEGNLLAIEYFKVREFACKDGYDLIRISPVLLDVLHDIRHHFNAPVTITSAFRTESHNKKVGGGKKSTHLVGIAADIMVKGVTPAQVAAYAETLMPDRGGIGQYKNFVHIDVRHDKSRWRGI